MNKNQKETTMGELVSQLEEFLCVSEIVQYRVTEDFKKTGANTYLLYNLEVDTDDIGDTQVFMFDDLEHIIKEDDIRVLNMFLESSIVNVSCYEEQNIWTCIIEFEDGNIIIEKLI